LGATAVYAAVTHGLFTERTMELLDDSPVEHLFVTNSVEPQASIVSSKVELVSVAPLFGEAICRIHRQESISVLFD
jgi:ribose-phosphate pyrophosphokinase